MLTADLLYIVTLEKYNGRYRHFESYQLLLKYSPMEILSHSRPVIR